MKKQVYVSKGGEKLENALVGRPIFVRNAICLDFGASTGGFTDILLKLGARLVCSIDVGKNQLHHTIRSNKRVKSFEGMNILSVFDYFQRNFRLDIIVIDLSFVSIIPILFILSTLPNRGIVIYVLIKPQFEVSPEFISKYGLVCDEKIHLSIKNKIFNTAIFFGFQVIESIKCPIFKKKANLEFVLCMLK